MSAAAMVAAFVLYRAGVIGPAYMSASKSTFIFVPDPRPADGPAVAPPPRPRD